MSKYPKDEVHNIQITNSPDYGLRTEFKDKLAKLGFILEDDALNASFERFKLLADKKKEIYDEDIIAILNDTMDSTPKTYELVSLQLSDCSEGVPSAAAKIKFEDKNGLILLDQIRAIDKSRIVKTIGKVDKNKATEISKILQEMFEY